MTVQDPKTMLAEQAKAYRQCLFPEPGSAAEAVLADLALFCRAHQSTAHSDPHMAARLDGRREVWLHIQERLRLDDDVLWSLYRIRTR